MIAALVGGYVYHQGFAYSVDFTGGTQIRLKFEQPTTPDAIRSALHDSKTYAWEGVQVVEFSPTEFRVRVKNTDVDMQVLSNALEGSIEAKIPGNKAAIISRDSVGSAVGDVLGANSLYAVILSILAIVAYITIRFQFAYAMGAMIALVHDALVIGAAYAITGREISVDVIAAILMVLGYSVNDTIVIFARIREMRAAMPNAPLYDVVNQSLNQTLRRTMLTSFATGLVVVALLLFGGDALRDFSFTMLLGIVFGTYSSIYIASPVMMYFSKVKEA